MNGVPTSIDPTAEIRARKRSLRCGGFVPDSDRAESTDTWNWGFVDCALAVISFLAVGFLQYMFFLFALFPPDNDPDPLREAKSLEWCKSWVA